MTDVYVLATACTPFGKQPGKSFKELTREAYLAVLADAGLDDGGRDRERVVRQLRHGHLRPAQHPRPGLLHPLVRDGLFPERVPMINVEGGCATASMAFHGAWKDVLSGQADLSLAIGVEKTFFPDDPARTLEISKAASTSSIPANGTTTTVRPASARASPSRPTPAAGRCSWTPTPCRRSIT